MLERWRPEEVSKVYAPAARQLRAVFSGRISSKPVKSAFMEMPSDKTGSLLISDKLKKRKGKGVLSERQSVRWQKTYHSQ